MSILKREMQYILALLSCYHKGLIAWDDTLYIVESLARTALGKIGARAVRGSDGILRARFEDGAREYREQIGKP